MLLGVVENGISRRDYGEHIIWHDTTDGMDSACDIHDHFAGGWILDKEFSGLKKQHVHSISIYHSYRPPKSLSRPAVYLEVEELWKLVPLQLQQF